MRNDDDRKTAAPDVRLLQNDDVSGDQRSHLAEVVREIAPVDNLEARHRLDTLAWYATQSTSTASPKPDQPAKHLVAYVVLVDLDARSLLLVDHRNAQRWLPTGGHVEPDEDPEASARRELREELGIEAALVPGLRATRS